MSNGFWLLEETFKTLSVTKEELFSNINQVVDLTLSFLGISTYSERVPKDVLLADIKSVKSQISWTFNSFRYLS